MIMVEAWWQHGAASILSTDGDVDAMIDSMVRSGADYSVASLTCPDRPTLPSGLPDHELRIAALCTRGGILYGGPADGADGTWYAAGTLADDPPLEYFHLGKDEEWPADSLVPIDLVRAAVKDFMINRGDRPTGVEWRPWPG
ncbi:Imm1 family immunity protein [Microlunatus sp. GCM10028923]|uniref:Imm1 family immunity protein n=1 Tax=Microlunatus sp. GCM10028923 TaxID=3273400 RepID=UPI0036189B22